MEKPSKKELNNLYWNENMSQRDLATKYNVNKDTIGNWMKEYEIKRRTTSEAKKIWDRKHSISDISSISELLDLLEDKIEPVVYNPISRESMSITLPLKALESKKKQNIVLTLVLSDLHLGHENHLPDTYWSTISNLLRTLKVLNKKFNVRKLDIVCNGDLVSGTRVYRYQEFQNIIQRGHWQVFLAEKIIKLTIDKINKIVKINRIYLIKGTHESLESNYLLYLRKSLGNISKYSSKTLVLNVAEPLGKYNILFTHGTGRSQYYPISYSVIRDTWKTIAQYRLRNIEIERIVVAHSHWLTPELELEGITLSETGGFQKWEYTEHQRPCGMLLLLYCNNEVSVIPIRPNPEIEIKEKSESALEYKNMRYYGEILDKHFIEEEPK